MKSSKVKTLVLTGYGINADQELAAAFEQAGASVDLLHVKDLLAEPWKLAAFQIIGFAGGFSFGDHLGSGRVLSHMLKTRMKEEFQAFLNKGNLVIGICNGFQTISKMGLVPNISGKIEPELALVHNTSGHFINKWVSLKVNQHNRSPWLKGLGQMRVPIRHGEGRLVPGSEFVKNAIKDLNLAAFWYEGENPNGSYQALAGITDPSGRVLGLMPHPEASVHLDQDPCWPNVFGAHLNSSRHYPSSGMRLFMNAVEFCRNQL